MDANTNPAAATESLAAWAARVAPTLDAAGWRQAERDARELVGMGVRERFTLEQARALLAERDRVAAGLTKLAAGYLRSVIDCDSHRWLRRPGIYSSLRRKGLVYEDDGWCFPTDFGREIARVLAP